MEKPEYKLRGSDFVPIRGYLRYIRRNHEALGTGGLLVPIQPDLNRLDCRAEIRAYALVAYNSLYPITGALALLGLEGLLW